MKGRLKSVIDSWITTIVAIVIYTIDSILIWKGVFDFWPEGTAGYVVGTTLLLFPKALKGFITIFLSNNKQSKLDGSD